MLRVSLISVCLLITSILASTGEPPLLNDHAIPTLYAPWREQYVKHTIEKDNSNQWHKQDTQCPFCYEINSLQDDKYLILHRAKYHVISLNLYPYTKGHILIIPYQHVAHLSQMTSQARAELMELATQTADILQRELGYDGFNLGFNFGRVAGASIPDHLHMQIIPRHAVEKAFIQLIGEVNVICYDLPELYRTLLPHFATLEQTSMNH